MTWAEDLDAMKQRLLDDGDLVDFGSSHEERVAKLPHWRALDLVAYESMPILLALGADELRAAVTPIAHIVEPAVQDFLRRQAPDREISSELVDLANTIDVFESVGCVTGVLAVLRPYLVRIRSSRDRLPWAHWNRALIALALDDPRTWKPSAGLAPDEDAPFSSGAMYQFNVQGLLAHLGGALANRATVADVLPAWRDFLRCAPILRETDQVDEHTCLWVARVVHHHIGGNPLASVGDFLHREVNHMAATE